MIPTEEVDEDICSSSVVIDVGVKVSCNAGELAGKFYEAGLEEVKSVFKIGDETSGGDKGSSKVELG